MNTTTVCPAFDDSGLMAYLNAAEDEGLDVLSFGVIGFDREGHVVRYNRLEAQMARFDRQAVLGQQVFVELAPCLNNFMVAGRFEERLGQGLSLDETLPYVLTFRMRPTRVRLRLLAQSDQPVRFIAIERLSGASA